MSVVAPDQVPLKLEAYLEEVSSVTTSTSHPAELSVNNGRQTKMGCRNLQSLEIGTFGQGVPERNILQDIHVLKTLRTSISGIVHISDAKNKTTVRCALSNTTRVSRC